MTCLIEGIKDNPVLILGGTGIIGSEISLKLAQNGLQTYLGSRGNAESQKKFHALSSLIETAGGVAPKPFYANLADEEQIEAVISTLDVPSGRSVDVFAIAAEGFNFYRMDLGRVLAAIKRRKENGSLLKEHLIDATKAIKEIVLRKEVLEAARETNTLGSIRVLNYLQRRGNLNEDSAVVTLSSSESDDTDLKHIDIHPGPFFYLPVGISKKEQVLSLAELATRYGFLYIDIVAPRVKGTGVEIQADKMISWINFVEKIPEVPVVSVEATTQGVVDIYLQTKQSLLSSQSKSVCFQRWYISGLGSYSRERPDWPKPSLPYL